MLLVSLRMEVFVMMHVVISCNNMLLVSVRMEVFVMVHVVISVTTCY